MNDLHSTTINSVINVSTTNYSKIIKILVSESLTRAIKYNPFNEMMFLLPVEFHKCEIARPLVHLHTHTYCLCIRCGGANLQWRQMSCFAKRV